MQQFKQQLIEGQDRETIKQGGPTMKRKKYNFKHPETQEQMFLTYRSPNATIPKRSSTELVQ